MYAPGSSEVDAIEQDERVQIAECGLPDHAEHFTPAPSVVGMPGSVSATRRS